MKRQKYYLYLGREEVRLVLRSLMNLKQTLEGQGRYTDIVDEIIIKVADTL